MKKVRKKFSRRNMKAQDKKKSGKIARHPHRAWGQASRLEHTRIKGK